VRPENDAEAAILEREGVRAEDVRVGRCLKCGKTIIMVLDVADHAAYRGCRCHDPNFEPTDFGGAVVVWDENTV